MIYEGFERAENEIFKEGLCQVEDHYVEPENCKKNRRRVVAMTGLSSLYCSHLNKKIAELQSNEVERFLEQELLIPGLICRSLRTLRPVFWGT
jgi:hypothetical protein